MISSCSSIRATNIKTFLQLPSNILFHYCLVITSLDSQWTRAFAERTDSSDQTLVAKKYLHHHPSPKWTRLSLFFNTAMKIALFFLQNVLKESFFNSSINFTANASLYQSNGRQCSNLGCKWMFALSSISKANMNIFFQYSNEDSSILFAKCTKRMIFQFLNYFRTRASSEGNGGMTRNWSREGLLDMASSETAKFFFHISLQWRTF